MISDLDIIGRIALSGLLGGLVGLERELHAQPAGLRTHMVVSIGASLLMLLSLNMAQYPGADPGRIASQVVAGMGFLGAGAIIRFGFSVKGLTTAACLWAVAGIGLACGAGYITGALTATGFILVVIFVLDRIEKMLIKTRAFKKFLVEAQDRPGLLEEIETILKNAGAKIKQISIHKDVVEAHIRIEIVAQIPMHLDLEFMSKTISTIRGIERIDIE
jgi:putative Mg2+ transporter-C (MgtC) family protein